MNLYMLKYMINLKKIVNFRQVINLVVLVGLVLPMLVPLPARAQAVTVPVAVTIVRVEQTNNPDSGIGDGNGDYYAKVNINGSGFESSSTWQNGEAFEPFWTFTQAVDANLGQIPLVIELWDADLHWDEHVDIQPDPGQHNLELTLDLNTGDWSGNIPTNQTVSEGDDGSESARIWFSISVLSSDGDADGDGLLDRWETHGLDADGDGLVDIDLPAFGADPFHKDLFVELDWMEGNEPTRQQIQNIKQAFALAPIDAGTQASLRYLGRDAKPNPDGLPGINLWIDTGGLLDTSDSSREDNFSGLGTCFDGIDNGNDGLADGADPDCLVGDNLGGGNQVPLQYIPSVSHDLFYETKAGNFDSRRSLVFRYGITATPGFEDGDLSGDSCFDNVDNGGGDEDMDGVVEIDGNDPDCWSNGIGGQGEIGGNDFIDYNDGGNITKPGRSIMHELGHTLNLGHGGFESDNCKPNYVSVMNYNVPNGIPRADGSSILDFSPPRLDDTGALRGAAPLPSLDESNLNEGMVLDPSDSANRFIFTDGMGRKIQTNLDRPVDWNGDGMTTGTGLSVNIDVAHNNGTPDDTSDDFPSDCVNNQSLSTLAGWDDWRTISFPFHQFGNSDDGPIDPAASHDPPLPELLRLKEAINTTDMGIDAGVSTNPAAAGAELTYLFDVANHGPNPGDRLQLGVQLPTGTTFVGAATQVCEESPDDVPDPKDPGNACQTVPVRCTVPIDSVMTCDLDPLYTAEMQTIAFTVRIDEDLAAGGPTLISASASIENLLGPDPETGNNTVQVETEVVASADLAIQDWTVADTLRSLLVGEDQALTLNKTVANQGPSAPVDARLTTTAWPPAGATVTPPMMEAEEAALAQNEMRSHQETFTVQCGQAGKQAFTWSSIIQAIHPGDLDPDPSNDTASLTWAVECVVPVAVNIKPGEHPNEIDPSGQEEIPVAILTTTAGEYDLPLVFDAAAIVPHSVRFGRRDEVWLDLGGAEALNGKHGNVEDVLELDESSRDGDTDMVLYFSTLASGIAPEDEEACVKGIWADGSGQEYKFFGCDSIATESSPWPKATAAEATTPVTPTHELYLPHTAK